MSTDKVHLYVPLRNEGTEVLRPTTGVFVGPDAIRLDPTPDYDPDVEEWEFPPGSEVRGIAEFRGGRQILAARSRVSDLISRA